MSTPPSTETDPIRVCLLNDHLGWGGTHLHGVSRYFLDVVPRFDPEQFDVRVAILRRRDALAQPLEAAGLSLRFLGSATFPPRALAALHRLVRRERIDVVHAQGYAGTTLARLLTFMTDVAVVVHSHEADNRYPVWMKLPDCLLSGREDAALANSGDSLRFFEEARRIRRPRLLYNGLDRSRLRPVPEGDRQRIRDELDIPATSPVLLTVTRFRPEKGNEVLLQALPALAARHPEAVTVLVGDGPGLQDCRLLAARLGQEDRVRFTGFRQDVPALLSVADVAVIPSLREGTCYALLEALAAGVAVVASRVGGPAEILQHDDTGLLVSAGDPAGLALALGDLLDDSRRRARLAAAGQKRSAAFDVARHVAALEDLYREVSLRRRVRT